MKCPCCGANLIYKDDMTTCEFCGYEEKIAVVRPEYNLVIKHTFGLETVHNVEIRIPDSNIIYNLPMNSTIGFRLLPGPHRIQFRVGKYFWHKVVVTSDDEKVVTIDFSYMPGGMDNARFHIDQPDPGPQYAEVLKNGNLPTNSALATVALIMSMTIIMTVPAFIMAIIDMSISRSKGEPVHARATVALVISILTSVIWTFVMIASGAAS